MVTSIQTAAQRYSGMDAEDKMISETARYLNMPTEAYLRLLIIQDEMLSMDDDDLPYRA